MDPWDPSQPNRTRADPFPRNLRPQSRLEFLKPNRSYAPGCNGCGRRWPGGAFAPSIFNVRPFLVHSNGKAWANRPVPCWYFWRSWIRQDNHCSSSGSLPAMDQLIAQVSELNQLTQRTSREDIAVMLPMVTWPSLSSLTTGRIPLLPSAIRQIPWPCRGPCSTRSTTYLWRWEIRPVSEVLEGGVYRHNPGPVIRSQRQRYFSPIRKATYRLDPVENDIPINPSHRIVVIEGNYIQLTIPPWGEATRLLDEKWFITVQRDVARGRVIKRHLIAGIAKTEEEAGKRFDENDWPNGEFLVQNSDIENADKKIHSIQDPHLSQTWFPWDQVQ